MKAPGGAENGPGPTHQHPTTRTQNSPCFLPGPECVQTVNTAVPVALGMLELWTEQSWREQGPGGDGTPGRREQERTRAHTSVYGVSGTLEPCLAKTSHSPLVNAISSLMGHLNSSGRKERKRGEGGPAKLMASQSTETTFHHSKLTQAHALQVGPQQLAKRQFTSSRSEAGPAPPPFSCHHSPPTPGLGDGSTGRSPCLTPPLS